MKSFGKKGTLNDSEIFNCRLNLIKIANNVGYEGQYALVGDDGFAFVSNNADLTVVVDALNAAQVNFNADWDLETEADSKTGAEGIYAVKIVEIDIDALKAAVANIEQTRDNSDDKSTSKRSSLPPLIAFSPLRRDSSADSERCPATPGRRSSTPRPASRRSLVLTARSHSGRNSAPPAEHNAGFAGGAASITRSNSSGRRMSSDTGRV